METAIERLERVIERRSAVSAGSVTAANSALESARGEIRELRETNQVVSARLDAAIGKVKVLVDD